MEKHHNLQYSIRLQITLLSNFLGMPRFFLSNLLGLAAYMILCVYLEALSQLQLQDRVYVYYGTRS